MRVLALEIRVDHEYQVPGTINIDKYYSLALLTLQECVVHISCRIPGTGHRYIPGMTSSRGSI